MATRSWSSVALAMALAGLVILPAFAFIGGHLVAGPYEGALGVIGYLGSIYADLLNGRRAAILLVLTPAIIVFSWYVALRLRSYVRGKGATGPTSE